MVKQKIINGFWLLIKGAVISVASLIGLMIGGALASALNIPGPKMPEGFNPEAMGIYKLICGTFFYILLGLFFRNLNQKKRVVFGLSFIFYFVVVNLLTAIEGVFFTTMVSLPYSALTGVIESLFVALGITFVFPSLEPEPSFYQRFREWTANFTSLSLAVRLTISWVAFLIIYYLVGMVIAPIVIPYYQTSSLGLKLPTVQTIILLQLGRGALILVATLPLIALWKKARSTFFICFGLLLFFKDVILGILQASWFPWTIRIVHGLELTVDSYLLAGVYSLMLLNSFRLKSSRVIIQD